MGRGRGQGARPEAEDDTATHPSQVKGQVGKGAAVVVGDAGGPNYKGKVAEAIQQQFETARRGTTDPLTNRHIPKKIGAHAREYFDRLRKGE